MNIARMDVAVDSNAPHICSCPTPHPKWDECPTVVPGVGSGQEASLRTLPPRRAGDSEFVGQRFGSFQVLRELGRGGMGTVLLAEHVLIPKRVAVKVLHPHLARTPELAARLLAEARAMSLVQHENVATLYDLDTRDGLPYFVMEYLEGQSLADFARGPIEPALAVELLGQVCDALGAAHARGIVHRDLKPANVFLVSGPQGRHRVKLLDFGIAKRLVPQAGETPTRSGVIMGTPEFMAPEQCSGGDVDARTDLYAVGVLGHLLLTGEVPFSGASAAAVLVAHLQQAPRPAHEVRPGLAPALSAVLLRALAKRPEERFSSAAELRAALEDALSGSRAPARAPAITFTASISLPERSESREYVGEQMGPMGLFLRSTQPPPPLLSEVPLRLRLPGGELACTGQVVRHVTAEQARDWNMAPGFGVELRGTSASFQRTFTRMLAGVSEFRPEPLPPEDPQVTRVLSEFRQRLAGDRYAVLGVPRDADGDTIRAHAREARERLEPLLALPLPPLHRSFVQRALAKVTECLGVLGHPERRVEYDAELRNVRGVMRCLAAGLTVTALEASRRRYFQRHPQTEGHSVLHMASAEAFMSAGRIPEALTCYEAALRADPLHLEALKRWHALRSRMRGDAMEASSR
ncbi:serine/threonine-protein kinase [Melittangium boletus]|uniref:non-specific serine/threonine protein kinase n=1 Tax=Melittangium boletus DSM 14713 TaxID=1294270 RepID=A0A250IHQ1_9BACT|nr:serine/threonine-protein kinase [Melittangium boletus]ATB30691.1 protein kinase [Melittangium boletus DSM 14713]